jgi:murein DD-endopeptidase MepM/ murein hydrolase activator NlpD
MSIAVAAVMLNGLATVTIFGDDIANWFRYRELINKEPETQIQIPIRGLKTSDIADTWHAPRGADRQHEGQDLFAPKGTPIYSATAGYVLDVGENQLGGRTVSVIGAGGRVYYYAHLHAYGDVSKGDEVTTETILGYVGTSGNAAGTPPHLHFGVYALSGPINPLTLF